MFEKKKLMPGDFVFDQRYGEFGLIYGQFPRYDSDKGPRYAVLVVNKGEDGAEFAFRIRYSPQKALIPIDPPSEMGGGNLNMPTNESEVSHFCNNQCLFSECDECIFQKYNLKREAKEEDDDE